jgi:hypothetical protein
MTPRRFRSPAPHGPPTPALTTATTASVQRHHRSAPRTDADLQAWDNAHDGPAGELADAWNTTTCRATTGWGGWVLGGALVAAGQGMVDRLRRNCCATDCFVRPRLTFRHPRTRRLRSVSKGRIRYRTPAGDTSYDLRDKVHTQAPSEYGFPRNITPDVPYHPPILGQG